MIGRDGEAETREVLASLERALALLSQHALELDRLAKGARGRGPFLAGTRKTPAPSPERLEHTTGDALHGSFASLIPEVRSNLGYALPSATGPDQVAAVPGRITRHGDEIFWCRAPCFGASRHVARVILTAMRFDPSLRAAMNIRCAPEVLEACRTVGLRLASFDRAAEPRQVKGREGATLSWGTERAFERATTAPEAIFDLGDHGKEPMIRVLDRDPETLIERVLMIADALGEVTAVRGNPRARRGGRSGGGPSGSAPRSSS